MSSGSVFYQIVDGHYVIKFMGEVRLTLCTSLDAHIEKVLAQPDPLSVLIDLTEACYLDSTTLGLIAKFAVQAQRLDLPKPLLVSVHPDVTQTLLSMGFDQVFVILDHLPETLGELEKIPLVQESVAQTQQRIINAHKVLMSLNSANFEAFDSLVTVMEEQV